MYVILYLLSIVLANVLTAWTSPIVLGAFIVPWGTFLIGFTFVSRDLAQNEIGRSRIYAVMAFALLLSAFTSYSLDDTLWITVASAATFIVSETLDAEVYSRMKASFPRRLLVSGFIGGTLDSAVFVIIGLSPLGAGFVPWGAVPMAIVSQVIIKLAIQVIAYITVKRTNGGTYKCC